MIHYFARKFLFQKKKMKSLSRKITLTYNTLPSYFIYTFIHHTCILTWIYHNFRSKYNLGKICIHVMNTSVETFRIEKRKEKQSFFPLIYFMSASTIYKYILFESCVLNEIWKIRALRVICRKAFPYNRIHVYYIQIHVYGYM